jgi:hypothetical protein
LTARITKPRKIRIVFDDLFVVITHFKTNKKTIEMAMMGTQSNDGKTHRIKPMAFLARQPALNNVFSWRDQAFVKIIYC